MATSDPSVLEVLLKKPTFINIKVMHTFFFFLNLTAASYIYLRSIVGKLRSLGFSHVLRLLMLFSSSRFSFCSEKTNSTPPS